MKYYLRCAKEMDSLKINFTLQNFFYKNGKDGDKSQDGS